MDEKLGNVLLRHSVLIIQACLRSGTLWTLENPCHSIMFLMPSVKKLICRRSSRLVHFDQCMYGLADPTSGLLYKKGTCIIGNVPSLAKLSKPCDRSHTHEHVIGKVLVDQHWVSRSKLAGVYPIDLCKMWCSIVLQDLQTNHAHKKPRLAQVRHA